VAGNDRPLNYCQTFQLLPDGSQYFVYNDIFKLIFA
jgi:hypothetical protein